MSSILNIFNACPPCEFGGKEYYGDSKGFEDNLGRIMAVFDAFSEEPLLTKQIHKVYDGAIPLCDFKGSSGEIIITYKKYANWYCFTIPFVDATHNEGKKTAHINISDRGWFSIGTLLNVALGCGDYKCGIEMEIFVKQNNIKVNLGTRSEEFPLYSLYAKS